MAEDMEGELIDAPTARDLANSFIKIISNVWVNWDTFFWKKNIKVYYYNLFYYYRL